MSVFLHPSPIQKSEMKHMIKETGSKKNLLTTKAGTGIRRLPHHLRSLQQRGIEADIKVKGGLLFIISNRFHTSLSTHELYLFS